MKTNLNKRIFWAGYCIEDRMFGIAEMERIINYYGYIVDFKRFSDVSISFTIELEERKLNPLYENLKPLLKISDEEPEKTDSDQECTIMLNVSFLQSKGDLKIAVPAIPG